MEPVEQVGVIAWKKSPDLRVLLIRRIPDGPWGIPKGGIEDHGNDHHEAARQECIEEAGAVGEVGTTFVGEYDYRRGSRDYRVRVLLMQVTELQPEYLEDHFRERRWFPVEDAAGALHNDTLRELVRELPQQLGSRKQ
jgi:hypothetical protein